MFYLPGPVYRVCGIAPKAARIFSSSGPPPTTTRFQQVSCSPVKSPPACKSSCPFCPCASCLWLSAQALRVPVGRFGPGADNVHVGIHERRDITKPVSIPQQFGQIGTVRGLEHQMQVCLANARLSLFSPRPPRIFRSTLTGSRGFDCDIGYSEFAGHDWPDPVRGLAIGMNVIQISGLSSTAVAP